MGKTRSHAAAAVTPTRCCTGPRCAPAWADHSGTSQIGQSSTPVTCQDPNYSQGFEPKNMFFSFKINENGVGAQGEGIMAFELML